MEREYRAVAMLAVRAPGYRPYWECTVTGPKTSRRHDVIGCLPDSG